MENVNIADLVKRLGSDEDPTRKMAAFKLQSIIGDPSFADVFISEGGLPKLRWLALHATGNTLAYSLSSFSRLLELDQGWDFVTTDLIERAVELVVTQPLVNILRGAMSILAAVVSHPQIRGSGSSDKQHFGFRALKPAIAIYPQFLEMLVNRLSSADHALCANALQLINALMRDAISQDSMSKRSSERSTEHVNVRTPNLSGSMVTNDEWTKFIKRLQDLGVIKSVYILMQSSALQDLAHPILEFQSLTKALLRKWREDKVDLERSDHRRALKSLHLASDPHPERRPSTKSDLSGSNKNVRGSRRHNPEKWRRLGFESEQPSQEFTDTGFLGMMDLTDYVRKREDGFARLLLEQAGQSAEKRCPVARASLAVTAILYDHFEVDKADPDEAQARYAALESRSNFEKAFRPLLLQWSRLHTAGLNAFLRLWKTTDAETEDFGKVEELVRILIEQVVGQAPRTKDVQDIEDEIQEFDHRRLRELQMELLELTYEDVWGHHLRQVRDELKHEALQFVKEQRIRCLLQGSWFPHSLTYANSSSGPVTKQTLSRSIPTSWRYVKLSHNRRWLHYHDFTSKSEVDPGLDELVEKIDLNMVSSVVSNVSASPPSTPPSSPSQASQASTVTEVPATHSSSTKITIHGYAPDPDGHHSQSGSRPRRNTTRHKPQGSVGSTTHSTQHQRQGSSRGKDDGGIEREIVLLTLFPQTHTLAAEWLDGLLMLLNQQPITADTNKLVSLVAGYGLKIRLLNVSFDIESVLMQIGAGEDGEGGPVLPSREGVDDEFYYDIGGMEATG